MRIIIILVSYFSESEVRCSIQNYLKNHRKNMAVLQVLCSAITLAVYGIMIVISSSSPSQDLIFGLVGQQWSSQAAKTGVEDALEDINNNSDFLSGYKLKFSQHTPGSLVTESQVVGWIFISS